MWHPRCERALAWWVSTGSQHDEGEGGEVAEAALQGFHDADHDDLEGQQLEAEGEGAAKECQGVERPGAADFAEVAQAPLADEHRGGKETDAAGEEDAVEGRGGVAEGQLVERDG